MSKQSNSQKQTVNVTVNNRMACCDKPKKKRRSKPKPRPEEPPMDINEFPALNTPALTRPSYAPFPIRNTVYMPSTVQISPEGMPPPIPEYADRRYTNMVRTLEDMQKNVLNEMQNLRQAMNPTIAPRPMPQLSDSEMFEVDVAPQKSEPRTLDITSQQARRPRQELSMQDAQTIFDVPPRQPSTPTTPSSSRLRMMTPNLLFEDVESSQQQTAQSPVANLVSNFEGMSLDSPTLRASAQRRRGELDGFSVSELQNLYYSQKPGGRGRGRPLENKAVLINRIIDIEVYGKTF